MEIFQYIFLLALPAAAAAFLCVRRRGSRWFAPAARRRLEVLERVNLTHQHSVHLLRVEDRWIAVGATSKGLEMLASGAIDAQPSSPGSAPFGREFADVLRKGASA